MCEDNENLKGPAAAIVRYLNQECRLENYEYNWPVGPAARNKLNKVAPKFDWEKYGLDAKQGNKDLKTHLSNCWENADSDKKTAIANWAIGDWGGINGNSPARIEEHIALTDSENRQTLFDGIASYSKLLAIKDPDNFAVYDSRVAAAISAIQLITSAKNPIHFRYPSGRGTEVKRFMIIADERMLENNHFRLVARNATYGEYLALLRDIVANLNQNSGNRYNILDVEMYLFSEAADLCNHALELRWPCVANYQFCQ